MSAPPGAEVERRLRVGATLGYLAARVCTVPGAEGLPDVPGLSDDAVRQLEPIVGELAGLVEQLLAGG